MSRTTIEELPFVSVIVPTHGRRLLLNRLLESLLVQDYPRDRYEILVVHNYTPDGTEEMVEAVARTAPVAVRYFRTDFRGPGASRQYGAERARGAVLAFIDDDCVATPGWLRAGVAALVPPLGLVQGRTLPNPAQQRRLMEKTVEITGPTPYFETCNIFYDARAFRAVGGFPPSFRERFYAEDTALGWQIKRAGYGTGFAAEAVVHHEVFAQSFWRWLREPVNMRFWPELVRAYPEIRETLYLRLFLSRLTAAFALAVFGAAAAVAINPAFGLLAGPYLVVRFSERGRYRRPDLLIARLLFGLPRAFVLFGTLLVSSMRARALVL